MRLSPRRPVLTLLLAGLALASLWPAGASAQPCASGADVRNLDDSAIPASLKTKILGTPGPIISMGTSAYPSGKVVVIRAASLDFPPNTAATTTYIDQIFFGTNYSDKNLRGYFQRNSYGQFLMSKGSIPSWLTVQKNLSVYQPGIEGNATHLQDILKLASVSWSSLDTNNDHTISIAEAQIVLLIPNALPGSGFASKRTVNAGSVQTPNGIFTFSNRPIIYFSLKAASDPQFATNPIRSLPTVAHELGHAFFALPDRYGANTGTGEYDMMGSGASNKWVHLPMHDKMKIGWIKPRIIQAHQGDCLQFVASELVPAALVVIPAQMFLSNPFSEYWIVENRNKLWDDGGYDDDLLDAGLAIWDVSQGTAPGGHNDLRLIDFSKPAMDPDAYNNPWTNALFKLDAADPNKILLDRNGQWNLLWFQNVSDPAQNYSGLFMFAEF